MGNKIILVTIEGTHNFGNRLQHYALLRTIQRCGCEADNLMGLPEIIQCGVKNNIKSLLAHCGVEKFIPDASKKKRTKKFLRFNERYLPHTIFMSAKEVRRKDWSSYAFAVTGSDQVWHNWHLKTISDDLSYYYLDFIDESKRVSYAPSFGFTVFPPEDIEQHRRGLMGMHALSCREQEGCEMIRELTGREAQKVLDPTLLLTDREWAAIERKPQFMLPARYLLKYFIGETTPTYDAEIKRIADERGLQILNINNKNDLRHYALGPDEFVWLVHHADTVCTDSFHATVFSICFTRNLRVFRRKEKDYEDMFGRLHDLLEPLGLMDLVYGDGNSLCTSLSEAAKAYLARERDVSLSYLKKSLGVV